jgi:hypothetical protein
MECCDSRFRIRIRTRQWRSCAEAQACTTWDWVLIYAELSAKLNGQRAINGIRAKNCNHKGKIEENIVSLSRGYSDPELSLNKFSCRDKNLHLNLLYTCRHPHPSVPTADRDPVGWIRAPISTRHGVETPAAAPVMSRRWAVQSATSAM